MTSTIYSRLWRVTSTYAPVRHLERLKIVEQEIHRFARDPGQLEVLPTVSALHEQAGKLVEQVLAENTGKWELASPRDLVRMEAMARAVAKRLLHEPTIRLRSLSEERGHLSLELVRELFGLNEHEHPPNEKAEPKLAEVHPLRRRH